jgi:peptidoglycan/LPS O-acetylase OafA/YrhL
MIECVCFVLSLIVLEAHIWPLNVPWLAWGSVFAFYTLSGCLMTRVLHERYDFQPRVAIRFALNRMLRLWPS